EAVTFQFFSDKGKNNHTAATHGTFKRPLTYAFHRKKQKEGCGVYVMVNRGDGKGRTAQNVVEIRALFIDLDGSPWELAAQMLKPHIKVESSPGHFHLYWLVSDCGLQQFKPLQQAIAKKFDGDNSCVDLARVLRLPGFYHLKKQPVMINLSETNDFPKYTTHEIIKGFDLALDEPATATTSSQKQQAPIVGTDRKYEHINVQTGEGTDLSVWSAEN